MTHTEIDTFRTAIADDVVKVQLISLINPDMDKLTNKSFLRGIIPDGWDEKVYEYEDSYIVDISIDQHIPRPVEMNIMSSIRKELGSENVLTNMGENTTNSTSIKIQLKKSNYSEKV